jgi:hypothetical protein
MRIVATFALLLATLTGCIGDIGPAGDAADDHDDIDPNVQGVGKLGIRRLTRTEYMRSVYDLLGQELPEAFTYLPDDAGAPFDNAYESQKASAALVEAVQQLAELATERLLADSTQRDQVVGCQPSGADDTACMRSFIESFGRRALRRPLGADDIEAFQALGAYAQDSGDFYQGVGVVVRGMLQHPEFLYRIEIGTPVPGRPGLFRLGPWEVATRMSFFLLGTTPDDALLDLAEADGLSRPEQVRAAATQVLETARAREQIHRFHAAWLGYAQFQAPSAELMEAMQVETTALVDRVLFEQQQSWLELFRSEETFMGDALADNYGLPLPGSSSPQWVSYGESGRKGILSHGSYLANGVKFGDTSPTQRGKLIRTRLLCESIPDPPPDVAADQPPKSDDGGHCKSDAYEAHSESPTCNSCHRLMDPLGFGLEAYDGAGRFRTTEPAAADCPIEGVGEMDDLGTFRGPGELAELLIESGRLEDCVVRQVYRFAWGRKEAGDDEAYLEALAQRFREHQRFDELLLDLVSAEAFGYRRQE